MIHVLDSNQDIVQTSTQAQLLNVIKTNTDGFSSLCLSEHYLFLGGLNSKVKVLSLQDKKEVHLITAYSSKVKAMFVVKSLLFTGQEGQEGMIKVWDLTSFGLLRVLRGHTNTIQKITGLNQNTIFSASSDKTVKAWDLTQSEEVVYNLPHQYAVLVVEWINDSLIVSGGDDCLLIVWQWAKETRLKTVFSHACSLTCLLKHNQELVTAGGDGIVCFWNIAQLINEGQSSEESNKSVHESIQVSATSLQQCCVYGDWLLFFDDDNNLYKVNQRKSTRMGLNIPYFETVSAVATYGGQLIVATNSTEIRFYSVD